MVWPFVAASGAMVLFIVTVNLVLNRGKIHIVSLLQLLLVGLPPALAPFCVLYFDMGLDLWIYIIIVIVVLAPSFVYFYNDIAKNRTPVIWPAILYIGILAVEFVPYLNDRLLLPFCIVGGFCIFGFLTRHFVFPYLNPMWLDSTAREIAKGVAEKGKYSPKPVIIEANYNRRFTTGSMDGLMIYIKKDKAIIKISKRLHDEIGQPNLSVFCRRLLDRIVAHERKHDAEKGPKRARRSRSRR